jgi:hypothetical protein
MYKYLSILLAIGAVVLGVFFVFEKYNHNKDKKELSNQIAQLEGTVQETKTAYSVRGVEMENLKVENKELQKKIHDRDESIAALGKVVLEWKDKYYKIMDAYGSVVDGSGGVIEIPADCKECMKDLRFRVDFKQEQDNIEVSGFTLTNPPQAEIKLHWTKPLILDIVLAKDDSGSYRIYVDPGTSGAVPTELNLKVDPSVFDRKWYEKIALGADLGYGDGVITTLRVNYELLGNWMIGPFVTFEYDGKFQQFYGLNVAWFPFRS